MGSGKQAKESSKQILKLLENLLLSGFNKKISLDLINSSLINKSAETFATLDIAIIDLYKGNIEFIKSGACPTYIKNKKRVQMIKSSSLPTGIIEGAHVQSFVVSHSYLINRNTKYRQNDESVPDNLMLRLRSTEQETKFRFENKTSIRNWKINLGVNLDYSQYSNTTFQKIYTNHAQIFDYHTYLDILRWGIFGTVNYSSMDERFTASLGLRADANNYSSAMKSLSDQLSPRISLSYQLTDHWFVSGNAGLYYQLPPYTALGFKNNHGAYANKYNLRYMKVSQEGLGVSWRKGDTFEVSIEGFYKDYDKIPLSVVDGIPLACKGNDYGVIGNELLTSTAQGRSYGAEILVKW